MAENSSTKSRESTPEEIRRNENAFFRGSKDTKVTSKTSSGETIVTHGSTEGGQLGQGGQVVYDNQGRVISVTYEESSKYANPSREATQQIGGAGLTQAEVNAQRLQAQQQSVQATKDYQMVSSQNEFAQKYNQYYQEALIPTISSPVFPSSATINYKNYSQQFTGKNLELQQGESETITLNPMPFNQKEVDLISNNTAYKEQVASDKLRQETVEVFGETGGKFYDIQRGANLKGAELVKDFTMPIVKTGYFLGTAGQNPFKGTDLDKQLAFQSTGEAVYGIGTTALLATGIGWSSLGFGAKTVKYGENAFKILGIGFGASIAVPGIIETTQGIKTGNYEQIGSGIFGTAVGGAMIGSSIFSMQKAVIPGESKLVYARDIETYSKINQETGTALTGTSFSGIVRTTIYERNTAFGLQPTGISPLIDVPILKLTEFKKSGYSGERALINTGLGEVVETPTGKFVSYQKGEIRIGNNVIPLEVGQTIEPQGKFFYAQTEATTPMGTSYSGELIKFGEKGRSASFGISFEKQADIFGKPSTSQALIESSGTKFATKSYINEEPITNIYQFGKERIYIDVAQVKETTVKQFDTQIRGGAGLQRQFYAFQQEQPIKPEFTQKKISKDIDMGNFIIKGEQIAITKQVPQYSGSGVVATVKEVIPKNYIETFNTPSNVPVVLRMQRELNKKQDIGVSQVPSFKQGIQSQQNFDLKLIGLPTSILENDKVRQSTIPIQVIKTDILPKQDTDLKILTRTNTITETGQTPRLTLNTPTIQVPRLTTPEVPPIIPFIKIPKIPSTTPIGGIAFPSGGGITDFSVPTKTHKKQKRKYTPSLFSTVTGLKGKPSTLDIKGFGIRPIGR